MTPRSFLSAAAIAFATGFTAPVLAENATGPNAAIYRQVPASYRFPLGDLEITALSDGTVPQDLHQILTGTTPADVDALLERSFLVNPVEASINAFLIRDDERLILVDTGAGQLFGPGNGGKLLDSLASIATTPEQITDILITHVHTDHSGGLAKGGEIVFPNAIVHVGEPDLAFFLDPSNAEKTGYARRYFDEAAKTIGVYNAAGKVKAFADGATVLPGITVAIHPGHTPGSAFYTVSSEGQSIVFIGDTVHFAAVQFPDPSITVVYDLDPESAALVRKDAFAALANERQLIAAPHLPFPGIGHIRANGDGAFGWYPLQYRNRTGR